MSDVHDVSAASTAAIASGTRLGPYEIVAPIGRGGMGEAYLATDTRLGRKVAIKILHERLADSDRRKRFLQEARAVSALNHPNIVALHDIASDRGVDYMVMEFVSGATLESLAAGKKLALDETVKYVQQIAAGLAAAHAAGVVHRDIKPSNVIITEDGEAKILDFGLAKQTNEPHRTRYSDGATKTALTEIGTVMGTDTHMSPEQAAGKAVDQRTDTFSLGVILHELLTGTMPFRGDSSVETMHAIINDPAPRLVGQAPELQEIVDKALAKDPRERYQHIGDLGLDLRRFAAASRAGTLPSAQRPSAGRSTSRWLPAAAVALALLAAAGAWLLLSRAEPWVNPLENARFTRLTDFEGSELDAAISPDGRFVAFTAANRDGIFDAFVGQVGIGDLANVTNGRFPELFHESIRSVGFSGDGAELWLRVSAADTTIVQVNDSAGGSFALPTLARGVWMLPTLGGTPRRLLERANSVDWSRDGTRIAYFEPLPGDPIFVANRQGADPRQIYAARPGEHAHDPTWSPDGRYIYFMHGFRPSEMDIWRVPSTGGDAERLTFHNAKVGYPTPLGDDTLLYIARDNGTDSSLYALDLRSRTTHRANLGVESFLSIDAGDGPNGPQTRLVASVANPSGTLWTVPILDRVAEERDAQPMALPTVRAVSPRYGPDYLLYLSSKGGGDGLWKFQNGVSTELWRPTDEVLAAPAAASPDGRSICFTVRKGDRYETYLMTADGTELRRLAESLQILDAVSWSPDGTAVVASVNEGLGGRVHRIPVDGGTPEQLVDEQGYNPVWSPDGRVILYYFAPQGALFPLRAITPDKVPISLPDVSTRGEGGRFRFLPDGKSFVVLLGPYRNQNFYLVDLAAGTRRQLTNLAPGTLMRNFDVSPDGTHIVFDRTVENSDVVLIDLPPRAP